MLVVEKHTVPINTMILLSLLQRRPTCRNLLRVSLISLKKNSGAALTTASTTENNCITILHAQNTTALQPNVFLTVLHQLLFTSQEYVTMGKGESLPRSAVKTQLWP